MPAVELVAQLERCSKPQLRPVKRLANGSLVNPPPGFSVRGFESTGWVGRSTRAA